MRQHALKWLVGRLPDDLRAITIRQPWAWAIVNGEKPVENRTQPLPRKFLGEIVAIHAGNFRFDDDDVEAASRLSQRLIDSTSLTTGAVVGFARLVGSIRRRSELKTEKDRKWFHGPHGWLLEDVVLLAEPVRCNGQLGFWRLPRGALSKVKAQVTESSSPPPTKVFSWGASGWGSRARHAVEMFDVVEKKRGFRTPLFVDVGARRHGSISRKLGNSRYRWFRELGNAAAASGRGPMRLVAPQAVNELLGLVLRAKQERRRVVFFCSCSSPVESLRCHRRLVAKELVRVARRSGLELAVEEWPGGVPRRESVTLRVEPAEFDGLCSGNSFIDLGRRRPAPSVSGLPLGSVITLKSSRREAFVSVLPPVFRRGRWQLPVYLFPVDPEDSARFLVDQAQRRRRIDRLQSLTTRG